MSAQIQTYNNKQATVDNEICSLLASTIDSERVEAKSKIWHAHPVWFLNGNPIVGYSKQKGYQAHVLERRRLRRGKFGRKGR